MYQIYIAFILSVFLFAGCSSTYRVSDFSSKEKFLYEFNEKINTKEVKVTLTNDSSFVVSNGVEINGDTLYSCIFTKENQTMQFPLADVADIEFLNDNITSAKILLKNGDKLNGNKVKVTKDSISFVRVKCLITKNTITQIDKVQTVSFKNRWKGISLWAISGALTGGIIGLLTVKSFSTSHWESQEIMNFPIGAGTGFIIGSIVGCFTSYPIIYEFNK